MGVIYHNEWTWKREEESFQGKIICFITWNSSLYHLKKIGMMSFR